LRILQAVCLLARPRLWRSRQNTTLAKIESDVIQNPSLQTITKIADGLDITLDDLIRAK